MHFSLEYCAVIFGSGHLLIQSVYLKKKKHNKYRKEKRVLFHLIKEEVEYFSLKFYIKIYFYL